MPRLQNEALLALNEARIQARQFGSSLYNTIYEGTTPESPLRRYLIDYCIKSTRDIQCPKHYPAELLVDIINGTRAEKRTDGEGTNRWVMSKDDLIESYFVDEEESRQHRHNLLKEVELRQAEEESALEASTSGRAGQDESDEDASADFTWDEAFFAGLV
ncbi:uncharacterized protein LY89DRAFT_736851 [Mollisia scopiformis]|uniref:Uncharacterized protein n=1 Tax=Mollisia scopiformis TaxID=149040 RepID=A0A194X0Y6_MOLSC|nr:uncharacterized protein LY89DRAFT_736851 [Mollisia scopiformis]KUJ13856.1 hypothetical protein LY89DRAFT_736851 [Mollisia scopiformis]